MKLALLLAAALSVRAQGGLDFPRVGEILDVSTGSVRELRGLAGAFTLGPSKNEGAVSLGCNGRICLTKTADRIISPSGTDTAAPAGPAIFGFDGERALIYFPETRQFARWGESGLQMLDWSVDGEVLAVRARGDDADIVVRRDSEVWISGIDGELRSSLPSETVAAALLPSGVVVYATSDALLIQPLTGPSLVRCGAGCQTGAPIADRRIGDLHTQQQGGSAIRPQVGNLPHTRQRAVLPMALYQLDATHVVARSGSRLFLISVDRGEIFELPGGGA